MATLPQTRRYLEHLRSDLTTVLMPELTSPRARTLGAMMSQLIDQLIARETMLPAALAAHAETEIRLLIGIGVEPTRDPTADDTLLAAAAIRLAARAEDGAARQFLVDLVEAEELLDRASINGADAGRDGAYRVSSTQQSRQRAGSEAERPAPERMTLQLRRHLPDHPSIACTGLEPIPGGFSKQTILLHTDGGGELATLVIRMDTSPTSHGYSVVQEFPLLKSLFALGFPVPEPLWLEADPAVLGDPFIVFRKVPGTSNMSLWAENDDQKRRVAEEIAQFLARLHAIDCTLLPFGPTVVARPAEACAGDLIEELYRIWDARQLSPNPLMEFTFSWLRHNLPRELTRACIVHADLGIHNVMVDGGRISAVLDWEFAHIGDPAEDLAYTQDFIEPIMPFDEFLAVYRAQGGGEYDASRRRFYRVLSLLRVAVGCYAHVHSLETGAPGTDCKIAFIGTMYARRFLIDAAKYIYA